MLKVASGQSVSQVAATGLLVVRHRSTVYQWLTDYFTGGIRVWEKTRQRRRKITTEQQDELLSIIIDKTPPDFGADQSRWTLALLRYKVTFLSVYNNLSGLFYLISALRGGFVAVMSSLVWMR